MQVVDANVLLYAANRSAPQHEKARGWLDDTLGADGTVGFAWVVLLAFLRLSTRAGLFPRPLSLEQAAGVLRLWIGQPAAILLEPSSRHLDVLVGLLGETGTAGNLVTDAHLAALAAEHGAEIVSFDSDFGRFPGVRWTRP